MTTANGQTPAPFMQDAPAVISTLGTDAHQGLTSEQAAHNLNQYGPNAFTKPKPESMLSRIVKTAADPMLIMLMIAAAIPLGVNIPRAMAGGHADILECVGIFFAIALSVTITVVMEGRSAKAFEALNDINDDTTVTVVRDGEVINGQSDDARVQGVRRFIEMIGDNPRLTATALQTVGIKGWDGFTLARVNG